MPIQPANLWERDGSLRDVYILETCIADWTSLIKVASHYPHKYSFNGIIQPLPMLQAIFANREGSHLLTTSIGRASVNCHFFVEDEIELDIDPQDVVDLQTHELLLQFLAEISKEVGKSLIVTPENSPDSVYLRYEPSKNLWT